MVVSALAVTTMDIGNVDHARLAVRDAPIMPPNVTNTIAPVADINCAKTSKTRLRDCTIMPDN